MSFVLLACALVASPAAWAGTEEDPEATDPADDTSHPGGRAYGDIVAGWIEDETSTTFTTVMKLSRLEAPAARLVVYGFGFGHLGVEYYTMAFVDENGGIAYRHGHLDAGGQGPVSEHHSEGSVTFGEPGYVRVAFPKAFLTQEAPEDQTRQAWQDPPRLDGIGLIVYDVRAEVAWGTAGLGAAPAALTTIDWADGQRPYVFQGDVPGAPEPEEEAPVTTPEDVRSSPSGATSRDDVAQKTPMPGVATLLLGIAASATLRRMRSQ